MAIVTNPSLPTIGTAKSKLTKGQERPGGRIYCVGAGRVGGTVGSGSHALVVNASKMDTGSRAPELSFKILETTLLSVKQGVRSPSRKTSNGRHPNRRMDGTSPRPWAALPPSYNIGYRARHMTVRALATFQLPKCSTKYHPSQRSVFIQGPDDQYVTSGPTRCSASLGEYLGGCSGSVSRGTQQLSRLHVAAHNE